jgi:hypothetical protein
MQYRPQSLYRGARELHPQFRTANSTAATARLWHYAVMPLRVTCDQPVLLSCPVVIESSLHHCIKHSTGLGRTESLQYCPITKSRYE